VLSIGYEPEARALDRIVVELVAHRSAIQNDPTGDEAHTTSAESCRGREIVPGASTSGSGGRPRYTTGAAAGFALAMGPLHLNAGAVRWMSLDGRGPEPYLFAQRTGTDVAGGVREGRALPGAHAPSAVALSCL
jgi:hypothetical protein